MHARTLAFWILIVVRVLSSQPGFAADADDQIERGARALFNSAIGDETHFSTPSVSFGSKA
jgi:hypothetical protein